MKFILLFSLILSITIVPALTIDDAEGLQKLKDRPKDHPIIACKVYDAQNNCIAWIKEQCSGSEFFCSTQRTDFPFESWNLLIPVKIDNCKNHTPEYLRNACTDYAYSSSENIQKYGFTHRQVIGNTIDYTKWIEPKNASNFEPTKTPYDVKTSKFTEAERVWDSNSKKWVEKSLLKAQQSNTIKKSSEILISENTYSSPNENPYIKKYLESLKKEKQTLPDVKKPTELPYYEKQKIPKPSGPWWCLWCN
tara:strand:- start:133 stop:882 length:750 start_codon:yes stop_codon:yes gene_type:complete